MFAVRHKVKELIEVVQDDQRLRDERKKAKKSRDKYKGVSSEEMGRKYDYSEFSLLNGSKSFTHHLNETIRFDELTQCFVNPGDRYSAEPKNFDDAFDEFDDKTNKRSSFRKFRERAYSGTKTSGYTDDVSNKRYCILSYGVHYIIVIVIVNFTIPFEDGSCKCKQVLIILKFEHASCLLLFNLSISVLQQ
jgi:hypothetical protein